jgi:hypothetical protein
MVINPPTGAAAVAHILTIKITLGGVSTFEATMLWRR